MKETKQQLEDIKARCNEYFENLIAPKIVEDSINLLQLYDFPIGEIEDRVKRLGEISVYYKSDKKAAPLFELMVMYCCSYQINKVWDDSKPYESPETKIPDNLLNLFPYFGVPLIGEFINMRNATGEDYLQDMTFTNLTKVIKFMTSEGGNCFGIIKALK